MYISEIAINNFRLLQSVKLCLEEKTTVIVGRNNSGKTSLTELFRRLLEEGSPRFTLEDFSLGVHEQFWKAFEFLRDGVEEEAIRETLPSIKIKLTVKYEDSGSDFGPLSGFIIDLNLDCTKAMMNIVYALEEGKIQTFFADIEKDIKKEHFFKAMKERIQAHFKVSLEAEDPNDSTNRKVLEFSSLRILLHGGFINAERALDNASYAEKAVLGKVLETLFKAASETANSADHATAETLKEVVAQMQDNINSSFNDQLLRLIPAFNLFGYPGLSDPKLRTETTLKVERLLSNHTTVGYAGFNEVNLPESYNGLGPRNLIFILLKLLEFFRSFTTNPSIAGVHLVFIEEPEAHLHPQMQNMFIRQLNKIIDTFSTTYNNGKPWPVQFIVTTHSSHIANEASFDSMRYFLVQPHGNLQGVFTTCVKDLRSGLSSEPADNREFLHKYMTLTRCDLLFADRAVLIEGPTERLLLPKMIEKVDEGQLDGQRLSSQYLSVVEVGGAYAHKFFNLLDFLNLRTLIITDLDTVDGDRKKCPVSKGVNSSNDSINHWYSIDNGAKPTKNELLMKEDATKKINTRRLAFQVPHVNGDACGRSFEDAFMLSNPTTFDITGKTPQEHEDQAWEKAKKEKDNKTDFALKYAIEKDDWVVPRYIKEGLEWLAQPPVNVPATDPTHEKVVIASSAQPQPEEGGDA